MLGGSGLWATYVPRLMTVFGPAVAAMIVSYFGGGKISVTSLFRSLRIRRRHAYWVVVSIAAGLLTTVAAFALAGVRVGELAKASAVLFMVHLVLQVLTVGIGEELGWRGWLLPTLAGNRTFAAATALTGFAWIVWHGPVFLSGVTVAIGFVALLVAMSVLLAWLWAQTEGSVGVVAVAHAAVNAPFFFFESHLRAQAGNAGVIATAFAYSGAAYLCLAIIACAVSRARRSRRGTLSPSRASADR